MKLMNENITEMNTVWGDIELAPNTELCFSVNIPKSHNTKIYLVAKDIYNLYINGNFVCFGPARAAKGYCRTDVLDIDEFLSEDNNIICVYVKSIYSGTLSFCKEEPLFGCKIVSCGEEIVSSADFSCYLMTDSVICTERMARQRGFCEVYNMSVPREINDLSFYKKLEKKAVKEPKFLPRNVGFAKNERVCFAKLSGGTVSLKPDGETERLFSGTKDFGAKFDGYERSKCSVLLSRDIISFEYDKENSEPKYLYEIFGAENTVCGKIQIEIEAKKDTAIFVTYDDLLLNGTVDCFREKIIHALKWNLKKGKYRLLSGDVYSAKYIQIVSDDIDSVKNVSVIAIENGDEFIEHRTGNEKIDKIIEASERTFRQNGYDLLTDCPSRERAAWLCDAYFSAKAEKFFSGNNRVEKNMLENYLLYENGELGDSGIIPMCYPSNITDVSENIPGWILWYVLELEDYLKRNSDKDFVMKFKSQLLFILDSFSSFENEYGLLENLTNWNFIEWSNASKYVDDVSIPNNILYSEVLRAVGTLLNDKTLSEKSKSVRENIISLAYNGTVFCDNLLRIDGKLVPTENHTELCQIFAVYFGILPDERFIGNFLTDFKNTEYADKLDKTALFIGEVLRIMALYNIKAYKKVIDKCIEIFSDMAEKTGTLWESFNISASCSHGFASVIGALLYCSFNESEKGSAV